MQRLLAIAGVCMLAAQTHAQIESKVEGVWFFEQVVAGDTLPAEGPNTAGASVVFSSDSAWDLDSLRTPGPPGCSSAVLLDEHTQFEMNNLHEFGIGPDMVFHGGAFWVNVKFRLSQYGMRHDLMSIDGQTVYIRDDGRLVLFSPQLDSMTFVTPGRWYNLTLRVACSDASGTPGTRLDAYLDGVAVRTGVHYSGAPSKTIFLFDNAAGPAWLEMIAFSVTMLNEATTADDLQRLYGVELVSGSEMIDTVTVPGVVYQILYDPPGDASYAYFQQSQSFETSLSTHCSFGVGATVFAGYEYENELFGTGVQFEVSQSVDYTCQSEREATVTFTSSSEEKTALVDDPEYVGPGNGDLVVCQRLLVELKLYRCLKAGRYDTANDSAYEYSIRFRPVRSDANVLLFLTWAEMQNQYGEYPDFLQQLRDQMSIDPVTHRVKPELIASGRLADEGYYVMGGGVEKSELWESTQSSRFSFSWDLDLKTEITAKVKAGGAYVGGSFRMSFGVGQSNARGTTYTRQFGYLFHDNEAWDNFYTRKYLDKQFGVYVFDVVKDSSFASFPFEEDYATRTIDWHIAVAESTMTGEVGQDIAFTVDVTYLPNSASTTLDQLEIQAAVIQFAHTASVDPNTVYVPRDSTQRFTVTLSAPVDGSFPAQVEFKFMRPNDPATYEVETVDLRALIGDVPVDAPATIVSARRSTVRFDVYSLSGRKIGRFERLPGQTSPASAHGLPVGLYVLREAGSEPNSHAQRPIRMILRR